ncbi:MAG: Xaa-Pro peptidase family protein [Clostridium sp.]|nr:Xaa-Pro peptidase family protein [Clostridium sp.]
MFKERIEKLRAVMASKNLDCVLLVGDSNRNYLSGFTGDESFSIITKDNAIFITDSRFTQQAKEQVKDYEIIQYNRPFSIFFGETIKKLNVKNVGFEEDVISYAFYDELSKAVSVELIPMRGIVEEIRVIKDKNEVQTIKQAAGIADKAFAHMLDFIKEGKTEREVGLELEFTMKKMGARDLSFPSIVASGVRSCLPHGQATEKILKKGDFLTLDFGCIFNDYCSDMTRTVVIGEASDKMKEIYNVVLKAQENAIKVIKPGIKTCIVDAAARDYIIEKGYGKYFGHSVGHGVGRQIHERPILGPKSTTVLKSGMIVTDEPGIYIPDFGGVRIEDLILVTDTGCEVLSKSPKNMICL